MTCKRCGKEMPPDQEKYCPYCGLHSGTYITPRDARPMLKKSPTVNRRTRLLSMLSVALIVAIIFIVVPILREHNKKALLADIDTRYNYIKQNFDRFTDDYTQETQSNQIAFFSAAVAKFEKAYPSAEEDLTLVRGYLSELTGLPPDDSVIPSDGTSTTPGGNLTPQQEYNNWLIANARDSVIDVEDYGLRGPLTDGSYGLHMTFSNKTDKDITQIIMCFRPLDKSGEVITTADPEDASQQVPYDRNVYSSLITGKLPVEKVYLSVWQGVEVDAVSLVYIIITYADGSTEYLPEAVCAALWGEE